MITINCNGYDHFSCSFGDLDRFPGEATLYVTELEDTNCSHCQIVSAQSMQFFSFHTKHNVLMTIDMDNDNIRCNAVKKVSSLFKRYKKKSYIESFGNGIFGADCHEFLISSSRIPSLSVYYSMQEMAFGYHAFATLQTTHNYLFGLSDLEQENELLKLLALDEEQPVISTRLADWLLYICFDPSCPGLQILGFKVVTKFKWPICYNMCITSLYPVFPKKHSPMMLEVMKTYKENMEANYPFITDTLQ